MISSATSSLSLHVGPNPLRKERALVTLNELPDLATMSIAEREGISNLKWIEPNHLKTTKNH